MKSISIVGVGPVGLAMFDALTRECRDTGRRVQINLIDPNPMGHGVYGWEKEDNLLLNTHCGEICCFMDRAAMSTSFDVSHYTFYEWVMKKELRLNGTALSTTEGREIKPTDFLPRHLLAQYLHECFQLIKTESTCPVELIPHSVVSLDVPEGQRKCYLKLDDDRVIECDEVIFCLGHGQGAPRSDIRHKVLNCYPAQVLKEHCHPDSRVIISGVGLSAMDAIVSLTQGKGGVFKYDERGIAIDYIPSGEEPAITMVTSKEMPFLSRPQYDVTAIADYTPHYFTKDNLEKLKRKEVCFEHDVLLLIKREVKLAYGVFLCKLEPSLAFHLESYPENISQFETIMAPYLVDCQPDNWFGLSNQKATPEGFYAQLNQDIANSTVPTAYKFAIELLRYLRADLRNFIDSESCSEKCYEDFYASAYKAFYRLNVGPPLVRNSELSILIKKSIVTISMSPSLHFDDQKWIDVDGHIYDWNIKAHIDTLAEHMECNPLINNLLESGKITLKKNLGKPIGIAVDNEFIALGENQTQLNKRIRFLGALTEGCHSFHYYLPSPKSRFNYYLQAQYCAKAIVSGQSPNV